MRFRLVLLVLFSSLAIGSTGCMMLDEFDDDDRHAVEYRRELPQKTEKPDANRGAYGGSD